MPDMIDLRTIRRSLQEARNLADDMDLWRVGRASG